jgi:hypothetical protein
MQEEGTTGGVKESVLKKLQHAMTLCDNELVVRYDTELQQIRTELLLIVSRYADRRPFAATSSNNNNEKKKLSSPLPPRPRPTKSAIFFPCNVPNQFVYRGGRCCGRACMTISLLILCRMHDAMSSAGYAIDDNIVMEVMDSGALFWKEWYSRASRQAAEQKLEVPRYPHIIELLGLRGCAGFCDKFGHKATRESGGFVRQIEELPSGDGDLTETLQTLEQALLKNRMAAAVVLVIAGQNSVALMVLVEKGACVYLLFDSHGGSSQQQQRYCEFAKFFSIESLVSHLIDKYNLEEALRTLSLEAQYPEPSQDLCDRCSYSASIFMFAPPESKQPV